MHDSNVCILYSLYIYIYTCIYVFIDVAARGLDVKEVQLVVNFDMPNNIEVYII